MRILSVLDHAGHVVVREPACRPEFETIDRYAMNNGSCRGRVQAQLSYTSAVYADSDIDGQVNFTATDR